MRTIMRKLISWQMNLEGILISITLGPLMIIIGTLWIFTQLETLLDISLILLVPLPFIAAILILGLPFVATTTHFRAMNFLSYNQRLKEGHIELWNDPFLNKFGAHGFIVCKTPKGYYRLKFLWL